MALILYSLYPTKMSCAHGITEFKKNKNFIPFFFIDEQQYMAPPPVYSGHAPSYNRYNSCLFSPSPHLDLNFM